MIESLNNYAGLFSLMAVVVAIVVPISLYRIGRKHIRQDMLDELKSMNENEKFTMSLGRRDYYTKRPQ